MIKLNKFSNLAAAGVVSLLVAQASQAAVIADNYIGANDHGWGDVIGSAADFDILGLQGELNGSILTVSIQTNFAGKGDDGLFSWATVSGMGIGYGDLFLSAGWNPHGDAPYAGDDNTNGNVWSYGFALDDRYMSETETGSGMLYRLNGASNADNILMSDDFLNAATFRNGQEVAVDKSADVTAISTGSWSIDAANKLINFEIDLTGTTLLGADVIGLRWGETCGNDVIEAGLAVSPVPVPPAVWLFASGLLGLVGIARRQS